MNESILLNSEIEVIHGECQAELVSNGSHLTLNEYSEQQNRPDLDKSSSLTINSCPISMVKNENSMLNGNFENNSASKINEKNEFKLNSSKKVGKFKILEQYAGLMINSNKKNENDRENEEENNNSNNQNEEENNNSNNQNEADSTNQLDSIVLKANNEASNCVENVSVSGESSKLSKTKKRGRPRKNSKINNEIHLNSSSDAVESKESFAKNSRRRSNRIKNLEKKESVDSEEVDFYKGNDESESLTHNETVSVENLKSDFANESKSNVKKNKKSKHKIKDKTKLKKHKKSKTKHKSKESHRDSKNLNNTHSPKEKFTLPLSINTQSTENVSSPRDSDDSSKPEKVKSRWRRNSEFENHISSNSSSPVSLRNSISNNSENESKKSQVLKDCTNEVPKSNESLPVFQQIDENLYLFEKKKSKLKKEAKKMICDCILTKEERAKGQMGCGDDCLNRMLMIECGSRCPLGEHCSNKRFQKKQHSLVEPFKTEKKGWGLKSLENLSSNTFIMEYVGEVIDPFLFHKRVEKYSKQKIEHHYFMALKSDEIIDATLKGNYTRFINHSCEPNSITQMWTVNGELKIGFFTIKQINSGEEITFDYQFQRYGKKAQKCFCDTPTCRGFIGSSEKASILTDGSKIPKDLEIQNIEEKIDSDDEFLEDIALEEEIEFLAENGGLRNRHHILLVSRLMLRAEKCFYRIRLIDIIMSTVEIAYLRLFLDYHGLQIIWSWMVEADDVDLKARLLELLEVLPIPNKTMLIDSKVLQVVERWADKNSPESQQYLSINDDTKKEKTDLKESKNVFIESEAEKLEDKVETNSEQEVKNVENNSVETSEEAESVDKETISLPSSTKLSNKLVIKTKTKSLEPTMDSKNKTLTIGFLSLKLLNHWKDLKEVFRIPRLERQKRHDDEAEADRRTKEEEERRARGLPVVSAKRAIDDKDYTIAGILGNKRRCLKNLTDHDNSKRNIQFLSTPNNNNNNSKLSKEEHRKLFEFNVAQNDYTEALKKYQEQLNLYRSAFENQILSLQQNNETNVSSIGNGFYQYSNQISVNDDSANVFQYINNQRELNIVDNFNYIDSTTHFEDYIEEIELKDLIPKFETPLITLCNNENEPDFDKISSQAIDNVDFSQIKFENDNFIESMEKKMFEETYPPAGIFYITEKGNTYFISFPNDKGSEMVVNLKENVTEPLPLSFTRKKPEGVLPFNWKYSTFSEHYYYYNKKKQIKQWHPPQDNQIDNFDDQTFDYFDVACDVSHPSTSNSPVNQKNSEVEPEEIGQRSNTRKAQEHFRNKISQFVVKCLNPYLKNSCKNGRITNSSDFKTLARKLTHAIVAKEMKQCKHVEDLAYTESVKHKAKEYVKRYMTRFGSVYPSDSSQEKGSPIS